MRRNPLNNSTLQSPVRTTHSSVRSPQYSNIPPLTHTSPLSPLLTNNPSARLKATVSNKNSSNNSNDLLRIETVVDQSIHKFKSTNIKMGDDISGVSTGERVGEIKEEIINFIVGERQTEEERSVGVKSVDVNYNDKDSSTDIRTNNIEINDNKDESLREISEKLIANQNENETHSKTDSSVSVSESVSVVKNMIRTLDLTINKKTQSSLNLVGRRSRSALGRSVLSGSGGGSGSGSVSGDGSRGGSGGDRKSVV